MYKVKHFLMTSYLMRVTDSNEIKNDIISGKFMRFLYIFHQKVLGRFRCCSRHKAAVIDGPDKGRPADSVLYELFNHLLVDRAGKIRNVTTFKPLLVHFNTF